MGRSVSRPSRAVTVCYKDISDFGQCNKIDDEGNETEEMVHDDDVQQMHWEDFVNDLKENAKAKWPSMQDADKWLDREDHVIMENDYAYIGVSEYCGLVSIWLVSKAEYGEYTLEGSEAARANHWCNQITKSFDKMFGELVKLGSMSNGEGVYAKAA